MTEDRFPQTRSLFKRMTPIIVIVLCLPLLGLAILSLSGSRPDYLGVTDGRLAPLPDTPNCVSSQAEQPDFHLAPWRTPKPPGETIELLKAIILKMPRTKIVASTDNYLYAEFTSRVFRFVDDVEFHVTNDGWVHFRSCSRVGHSDLGVNRRRMEQLASEFRAAVQNQDSPDNMNPPEESERPASPPGGRI